MNTLKKVNDMYLVMTLKTKIETNAFPVHLAVNGLAGMLPVFRRKREAAAYAKRHDGAQILEIALKESE